MKSVSTNHLSCLFPVNSKKLLGCCFEAFVSLLACTGRGEVCSDDFCSRVIDPSGHCDHVFGSMLLCGAACDQRKWVSVKVKQVETAGTRC